MPARKLSMRKTKEILRLAQETDKALDNRCYRPQANNLRPSAVLRTIERAIEDISGGFISLPDGRMRVNEFLQVSGYENVFAAGDCAAIESGDAYLRKAAAFSVSSGATAGKNIVRSLKDMPLKKFRPVDLGWVIPMYPSSIGKLLGIPVRGRLGLGLHYLIDGYRTHDLESMRGYLTLGLKNMIGAGEAEVSLEKGTP